MKCLKEKKIKYPQNILFLVASAEFEIDYCKKNNNESVTLRD